MPTLSDIRVFAKYHLKRRVYDYPAPETELGVQSLDFDLDAYGEELAEFGDHFEIDTVASVDYKNREHPITRIDSKAPERATVLVLAGVHGNEHAGLLAIPLILARFRDAHPGVRLVVLTPVNPVGAAELSRYNGDGFDINRDFVRFETLEAQIVRDEISATEPDFVVSLHEGPQDASFMFTNRHVERGLARELLDAMEAGGTVLAEKDYFGLKLEPPGYSPSSPVSRVINGAWARALKMKTTGRYAEELGIPEITLESSWRQTDREARIRPHVDLVGALCRLLGTPE